MYSLAYLNSHHELHYATSIPHLIPKIIGLSCLLYIKSCNSFSLPSNEPALKKSPLLTKRRQVEHNDGADSSCCNVETGRGLDADWTRGSGDGHAGRHGRAAVGASSLTIAPQRMPMLTSSAALRRRNSE